MSSTDHVDLVVTGMTCASCAARIQRKLNKLEGVEASVNYATGIASVNFTPALSVDDLVKNVQDAGYNALPPSPLLDSQVAEWEAAHEKDLSDRWRVGAVFAIMTMALAMIPALQFSGWGWAAVILATPVVTWAAWPLHVASFRNARHRATTMDTLVSIGVIAAYVGSIWQLVTADGHHMPHIYIDVAVVVPVFVLLGRWLEARNTREAGSALRALADATPSHATVMREGVATEVPLTEIVIGEKVVVSPESTIPVDGIVLEGISSVSTALLTGESMPHPISPGSSTVAGALNHDGKLLIEVTAVGAGSHIARIAALVAAAQSGRANIARLADRISAIFVPAVLLLTVATGIVWTLFIDSSRTIDVVIAVLVIACPCALGLATPTALVVGSGRAAKLGFIISGPEIFEQARNVDVVVFDKTGTLTTGEMKVSQLSVPPMWQPALAALSRASAHPISVATADALRSLTSVELTGVTTMPGRGIRGKLNDDVIEFGSRHLYPDLALTPEGAATQSWLFVNGEVVGWVSVTDTVDPTAAEAIRILHARGVHTVMASGDLTPVARNVGQQLGITDIRAELKPEEKIAIIQEFKSAGKIVAMVGDGTNDAPALAAADIGIAMGRGTEVARATADITLLRPDVRLIPTALSLSQATLRTIKQNLGWAFGYNLAALPLAMSGQLNPVIAGIAMSASSVLVVTNSLRLRRSSLLS